jgi:hypothetical protein
MGDRECGRSENGVYVAYTLAIPLIMFALLLESAQAQGRGTQQKATAIGNSIVDRVTERFVDAVNRNVLRESVDPDTRRLQIEATRVIIRGSDRDWQNFISQAERIGQSPSAGSRRAAGSSENRSVPPSYIRAIRQNVQSTPQVNVLVTRAGDKNVSLEVPPYIAEGLTTKRVVVNRIATVDRMLRIEGDGNPRTREFLLIISTGPASAADSRAADDLPMVAIREAFGTSFAVVAEADQKLDPERMFGLPGENWLWGAPTAKPDLPHVFTVDLDNDRIDEVCFVWTETRQNIAESLDCFRKTHALAPYQPVLHMSLWFEAVPNEVGRAMLHGGKLLVKPATIEGLKPNKEWFEVVFQRQEAKPKLVRIAPPPGSS